MIVDSALKETLVVGFIFKVVLYHFSTHILVSKVIGFNLYAVSLNYSNNFISPRSFKYNAVQFA